MALQKITLILSLFLFIVSCTVQGTEAIPTSTGVLLTSTWPALPTPADTETLPAPTPQPTAVPVEGTSTTEINVRSEPSTASTVLGTIPPNSRVQIVGKDPGGNWWQILFEQGIEGKGWVTAQYVTTANRDAIRVVGSDPTDLNRAGVAVVQQQINVRSGPGTSFNSLGTLNAQDVVHLIGQDPSGAWLQINFAAGPEGKGWVNAVFVRAQGMENLPILTEAGQVVGTGTPTSIPPTPAPTILPAWVDQDSQSSPAASVHLQETGTHTLIYTGDVSSPDGDTEDWIHFKPYSRTILLSLACVGSTALRAELLEDGVGMDREIACGDHTTVIPVKAGSNYLIHLSAESSAAILNYIQYTIKIETSPS